MCDELKKKTKIGIEITFSNKDFRFLKLLDKKEDKKNFGDGEFTEFCNGKNCKSKTISSNYESYVKYLHETYIEGWKAKIKDVADKNKFYFIQNNYYDKPLKGSSILESSLNQLKVECKLTGKVNEYDDSYLPEMTGQFDTWDFNVDIDEGCIEVHAKEMTLEGYINYGFVIKHLIYGIANKLGLYAGYAGKGGGHLSIDMESGFGDQPIDIIKTVILFEIMQSEMDKHYGVIDVTDNVNAPYYFESSRNEFKRVEKFEDTKKKKINRDYSTKKLEELSKELSVYSSDFAEVKFDKFLKFLHYEDIDEKMLKGVVESNKYGIRRWFISFLEDSTLKKEKLETLGKALKESPTADQKNSAVKDKISNTPLHYQAINLEHTIANKKEDRRVEFRRLVSQRNIQELTMTMKFLLNLIEYAKTLEDNSLIYLLKSNVFLAIMKQSTMEKIRKLAENLAKKES